MSILDITSEIFGSNKQQTSRELVDLKAQVSARLGEVEQRQAVINKRERQQVTESGDSKALAALEAEETSLKSEELALRARQSRLHRELQEARAIESVKDAKAIKARLADQVGHIESMQAQLKDAQQALERSVTAITEARRYADDDAALLLDRSLAERIALVKFGDSNMRDVVGNRAYLVNQLAPKAQAKKSVSQYPETAGVIQ